jgi:hypothetical protein
MKRTCTALAVIAVLGAAGTADAKPVRYEGRTDGGQPMAFTVKGSTVSRMDGTIPTTCVPVGGGTPRAGAELFAPPGSFRIGRTRTVAVLQDPAMHYADVTKHYRVKLDRRRGGGFRAILHVNFSFNTVGYGSSGPYLEGWVCQGDDTFTASRR